MAGYHETYTIQSDHGTEDLNNAFCALKGKKFATLSPDWDVHKGKLIHKHQPERKVVAKLKKGLLLKECEAEVKALKFVQKVLERVPNLRVKIVPTFYAEIQTLSRVDKLISRKQDMVAVKGGFVLIQDRVEGEEKELWVLDRKLRKKWDRTQAQADLVRLALESHKLSKDQRAIASMRGFAVESSENNRNSSDVTYYLTSVTVHSKNKAFGPNDHGSEGVEAFKRWAANTKDSETSGSVKSSIDLCDREQPTICDRLQPTAPCEEEENCVPKNSDVQQLNTQNLSMGVNNSIQTPVPEKAKDNFLLKMQNKLPGGHMDTIFRDTRVLPPPYSEIVRPADLVGSRLQKLGPPPPYSETLPQVYLSFNSFRTVGCPPPPYSEK